MGNPKRMFDDIGPELAEKQKISKLRAGVRRFNALKKNGDEPSVSVEDEAAIRDCLTDPSPKVREEAIGVIAELRRVTGEDVQAWIADPDKDVRARATGLRPADGSSEEQKNGYLELLIDSWLAHPDDFAPDLQMTMLASMKREEWLEPTWRAAEKLLASGDNKITMSLQCGYLEDVVREPDMVPDHPLISPWIRGDDKVRKQVLLEICRWLRLKTDNLNAIAAALASDADPEIADYARGMIEWYNGKRCDS